jgi:hypothetical protein
MPPPLTRRLAGIRFVQQPPELREKLPRMDIAVFVGFAAAGPLHRPVVVEDAKQFSALFGDDLPLAWDNESGRQNSAHLGPAVRAFFRNGGRRCWAIRVAADNAETSLFPVPGLAKVNGSGLQPAFAQARSPGSWFDRFRAATALTVRTIAVLGWSAGWNTIDAVLTRESDLQPGDLLRFTFAASDEAFFRVESVAQTESSPPDFRQYRATANVAPLGMLRPLFADEIADDTFKLTWDRSPQAPARASANLIRSTQSPPNADDDLIALDVDRGFSPPAGSLLQMVATTDDDRLWLAVEEREFSGTGRIVGRVFSWTDQLPAAPATIAPLAERLSFEFRVSRGETGAFRIGDLGFAAGHPRCWDALPDDARMFSDASASEHAALCEEAGAVHFPLAGNRNRGAQFIPIGMTALAQPSMAPQNSGRSALERDGLADFSASLFLDSRLVDSDSSRLLADADFIRYRTPDAPRLTGIHAALEIEEASLIAVPDAMYRRWHPAVSGPPPQPVPSPPRPHPSWWHFLECNPPASPPADAVRPDDSQFRKCGLDRIDPPELAVEGPDASGAFTLEWSSDVAEPLFVLEEATEPDFDNAFELWRGSRSSYTVLSRAPAHYYYRVRVETAGESSDWSNGVVVSIAGAKRWQLEAATDFDPGTLLDVHRALLRLCGARGDIMAALALPQHYRQDEAVAYVAELKGARLPASGCSVRPLGTGEASAFSYGAIYHPWFIVREETGALLTTPPDGAATGLIARRALSRGAWIAPANEALAGVVSLTPRLGSDKHLELLLAQLNLIRHEARGFLALNADTLSTDEQLRPINVRRLLILLRRAALRLGMTFVFEPNDRTLRRVVQGAFEAILQQLFTRGAFAGATPDASYRVVTDDSLNTAADFEQGRFRVDLKVAPALPMSFLTVRLVQLGDRAVATEIS